MYSEEFIGDVTRATPYSIRQLMPSDQAFLWEMLYHSLHVPEGRPPFPREIIDRREIARYVTAWGRTGDSGFVAINTTNGEPIGAAWLRLLTGDEKGYGYVDDQTPELAIAVLPEYRGQGIGFDLLRRLLQSASTVYPSVSLSVSDDNPAVRLYERAGFERLGGDSASATMIRMLNAG
jgi:ribosomal protein S18 acetylase RimI-like enzyme